MMEGYTVISLLLCLSMASCFDNFDLRLAGTGSDSTRGRVEVYYNGEWGTVCDDNWSLQDADVVCNQLGLSGAIGYTVRAEQFGEGSGQILLDEVRCNGGESSLADCNKNPVGIHDCAHREDAGVICRGIRLTGEGSTVSQGRVEIFYNGEWGTVCDDSWGQNDANVVCNELGFPGAADFTVRAERFGEGSGNIVLDDVVCNGDESRILDCPSRAIGTHNCGHDEDAGVICNPKLRLAGVGSAAFQGRVEVYYNGEWGTVCDDYWDLLDADVVCNELGFPGAADYTVSAETFGEGSGSILLDDVRCTGEEPSIFYCNSRPIGTHNCRHREDAGVICNPAVTGPVIRLGGSSKKNDTLGWGVVEVYKNGEWGTVCGTGWTQEDANVACGQLGFSGPAYYPITGLKFFGVGTGPVLLSDVTCTGDEDSILDCPASTTIEPECTHEQDAEVLCKGAYEGPVVRLGGYNKDESLGWGVVEVYKNGEWGTVCSTGWTQEDADVVCSQLGFSEPAFYFLPEANFFGPGSGSVLISDVDCTGDESSIMDCPASTNLESGCTHDKDTEVLCSPLADDELSLILNRKTMDMEKDKKFAHMKEDADMKEKDVLEALADLLAKLKEK